MEKIFIQHDSTILRIYPALAKEIGLNESILLLQIEYWISISSTEFYEGRKWTYQSLSDMKKKAFPFWSRDKINRIIRNLIEQNLIFESNFNKKKYDKTRWISLNYNKITELNSVIIPENSEKNQKELSYFKTGLSYSRTRDPQNKTRSRQNKTTIPEITTEITTDNIFLQSEKIINSNDNYELKKENLIKLNKSMKLKNENPIELYKKIFLNFIISFHSLTGKFYDLNFHENLNQIKNIIKIIKFKNEEYRKTYIRFLNKFENFISLFTNFKFERIQRDFNPEIFLNYLKENKKINAK